MRTLAIKRGLVEKRAVPPQTIKEARRDLESSNLMSTEERFERFIRVVRGEVITIPHISVSHGRMLPVSFLELSRDYRNITLVKSLRVQCITPSEDDSHRHQILGARKAHKKFMKLLYGELKFSPTSRLLPVLQQEEICRIVVQELAGNLEGRNKRHKKEFQVPHAGAR